MLDHKGEARREFYRLSCFVDVASGARGQHRLELTFRDKLSGQSGKGTYVLNVKNESSTAA